MAGVRKLSEDKGRPKRPPATTPEGRELQLVAQAVDLAEKQIRDGTASAQVITHYLRLGTTRERLEQEKLTRENALLLARVETLSTGADTKALYEEAIKAMASYSGAEPQMDDGYED